jgi:arsenate reductase-like glutaredoxin family protein
MIVKSNVLSPYGPVRAGLTTWQTTQDQQLTELLSSLESEVATLVSKSCTVLDTLNTVTQEVSAVLSNIAIDEAGTDE